MGTLTKFKEAKQLPLAVLLAAAACDGCGHKRKRCPYAWANGNLQRICPKLRSDVEVVG